MNRPEKGILSRIVGWLHNTEDFLLVVLVLAMVVFAVAQIALRNFFDSGVLWIDPILRLMMLWVALVGALVASRSNKHIAIDILYRLLPPFWRPWVQSFTFLFTAIVCGLVAYHSTRFVIDEYTYESVFPDIPSLPTWPLQIIIPFAFFVISIRYLIQSLLQAKAAVINKPVDS